MRKKPTKSDPVQADIDAFYQAMGNVKPLKVNKIKLATKSPPVKKAIKKKQHAPVSFHFDETEEVEIVQGETYLLHKKEEVSDKILRKLRKGQYNVEAILDLHGKTVEEAKVAVSDFLLQCLHDDLHVVLIIHGKGLYRGLPVLKNKLNQWLRKINSILAFCSASPSHGSRGAIYVLLRRISVE